MPAVMNLSKFLFIILPYGNLYQIYLEADVKNVSVPWGL